MRLRLFVTGGVLLLATLMAVSVMAAVTTSLAHAAVPPFDPSGNGATQGTISLYDDAGTKITSGALADPPAFALANSDTGRGGDTLATLYAATPQEGVNPILWPASQISVSTAYPSASAPGVLQNNSKALAGTIFQWLDPNDADSYATAFPNTNTTASWQKLYQLRILTSGPGQAVDPQRYSSTTIAINTTNDTWTQVYPDPSAAAPTVVTPAAVTGSARVGQTVSCDATFSGATSTTYKWFRGANAITGAASQTYSLVGADYDKVVKCRATGTNANGSSPTTSPGVTVGLGDALVATTNPTITGTPRSGNTVSTTNGVWSPAATSYKYQWFRGANAINGATAKNYTIVNNDVGKKLSCKVTAKKKGYKSGVKKTAAVNVTN